VNADAHPSSLRAERLITRVIEQLAAWGRSRVITLRAPEIDEVSRWAVEARQELLASRGDPRRLAIPAAMRARVIARAAGRCEICRNPFPAGEPIHVDHIVPVARFGATTDDNLRAACASCNLAKGAREAS
jgi:5-methylcytosine-specific restriction endonuclease McrA